MKKIILMGCLLALTLLSLAGCGGGTKTTASATLYSEAALDGGVRCFHLSSLTYDFASTTTEMGVGNDIITTSGTDYNDSFRGYVSFDLSEIPDGATIQSATLRVYDLQSGFTANLFTELGNLLLDHVNYESAFSDASTIYNLPALSTAATPLATSSSLGWKELSVTDMVQNDVTTNRNHSQFRLRFTNETPLSPANIFTFIATGEHATYKPELVITYQY